MFCSEEDRALAKTSDWINGATSAVGHMLRPRRSSEDEREPLISRQSIDEEMGLGMVCHPTQPNHAVLIIPLIMLSSTVTCTPSWLQPPIARPILQNLGYVAGNQRRFDTG